MLVPYIDVSHFSGGAILQEEAMRRAKTAFASARRSVAKSLEKETAERVMAAMMGGPEQVGLRG